MFYGAKASYGAWPSASNDGYSYCSTPVTSQFCDSHAVGFIKLNHYHVRGVNWYRLFFVVGLTGLDSFNVQATLLRINSKNGSGEGLIVALSTVTLSTMGVIATGCLDYISYTDSNGANTCESCIWLGKLQTSRNSLTLFVHWRVEVRLSLFSWFHTLDHVHPSHNLFCICSNTRPPLSGFSRYWPFDIGPLNVSFLVDNDTSIVFELHPCTVNTTERSALADDNCVEHLSTGVRSSFLDRDLGHVTNTCCGVTTHGTTELENVQDLNNLCTGVIGNVKACCGR
jgi:hypothetical protein